jgi:protein-S-isoprenylcysteine O-methyltransferase Ste14
MKKRLPPQAGVLSLGFFAAAISLVAPAFLEFKRAATPVDVSEETMTIVESGPYAHTRNPIYLGLTLLYVGVALAARARLPFAVLPAIIAVMNAGVIEREESYLERKFGEAYRRYKDQVPRWI